MSLLKAIAQRADKMRGGRPKPKREDVRAIDVPCFDYSGCDLTPLFKTPNGAWRLKPIQSEGLLALRHANGAVWVSGVGAGKTLKALLAADCLSLPSEAFPPVREVALDPDTGKWVTIGYRAVPECEPVTRVLYMTKTGVVDQTRRTVAAMQQHWNISPKIIVRSYHDLSQPRDEDILPEWIGPEPHRTLIVLDECHKLKRKESARTDRMVRAIESMPGLRFVVASGTMISKKLADASTIMYWALRDQSPLPKNSKALHCWGDWIDHRAECNDYSWATVKKLVAKFNPTQTGGGRQGQARDAFAARLMSAPGVVVSTDSAVSIPHTITLKSLDVPDEVTEAIAELRESGRRPDGEVFEDALAVSRTAKQMAAGFWYKWRWGPDGPDYPWLDARAEWHRQLRAELDAGRCEGYDSPMLVTNALRRRMEQGDDGGYLGLALREWDVERERRPQPPPTDTVWLSDYLVADAAKWLDEQAEPALLWYSSRAMAQGLADAGVHVILAGEPVPLEGFDKLALSIKSHGTGLDGLQRWSRQLIVQPPSSGEMWEQLLGRLHRPGQESEIVRTFVYAHVKELRDPWRAALENARMLQRTTLNKQKLCLANIVREG